MGGCGDGILEQDWQFKKMGRKARAGTSVADAKKAFAILARRIHGYYKKYGAKIKIEVLTWPSEPEHGPKGDYYTFRLFIPSGTYRVYTDGSVFSTN